MLKRSVVTGLILAAVSIADAASFRALNHSLEGRSAGRAWAVASALAVPSTTTVYSDELSLSLAGFFGLSGSCSGDAPDVKLEWQSSNVADTASFVTTSTMVANVTGTITPASFTAVPAMYGRVKLTGNGGNSANTTCTVYVFLQGNP